VSQRALLTRIVAALDRAGIPYMLTGSLASSIQGEPRATHDIDLVVDIAADDVPRVVSALSAPGIYLDESAVDEATRWGSMFNLVDTTSGDKAGFWLLTTDLYDRTRFARRTLVAALGLELSVSTPEDTVLMKLLWSARAGGSQKQLDDALHVYELQAGSLDEAYLDEWAGRLDVAGTLAAIREQAQGG
jgi:hypothetical protein